MKGRALERREGSMAGDALHVGVAAERVVVPLPGTGCEQARLGFDNGVERLVLHADQALHALAEARFGEPLPVLWSTGCSVHVEYPLGSRLLRRTRPNTIRVSTVMAWSLDVHGATADMAADLTAVRVAVVSFHGGVARSRLAVGRPHGLCTIRLSSVKDLRITRPADTPVRLEVAKGATNVHLDGRRFGAVADGLSEQTAAYQGARDRYLVIVSGGVDGLTVQALPDPQPGR
jgi:hypothetical protein